jgi:ferredoxin-NADP reductase
VAATATTSASAWGRVSPWAHGGLDAGDRLLVSGPYGDAVPLDDDTQLIVLPSGIGVTPGLAILDTLARSGSRRPVDVVHVERHGAQPAHWDEVEAAVAALPNARAFLYITGCSGPVSRHFRAAPRSVFIRAVTRARVVGAGAGFVGAVWRGGMWMVMSIALIAVVVSGGVRRGRGRRSGRCRM